MSETSDLERTTRGTPDIRRLPRGGLWDREQAKVYFIAGAGLIKIGVTTDIDKRLSGLTNSCPVPLRFLGYCAGTQEDERALHARFAHLRRHGEWFTCTPELREAIKEMVDECWHADVNKALIPLFEDYQSTPVLPLGDG